jgi:hypothetical protein
MTLCYHVNLLTLPTWLKQSPGRKGRWQPRIDPEARVLVKRAHDYLERSFVPPDWSIPTLGCGSGPLCFRQALYCAPSCWIDADRQAMLPPPPPPPTRGAVALVAGTLWPCRSWDDESRSDPA